MHNVEIIRSEAGKMEVLIPLLWLGTVVYPLKASILLSINGNNICLGFLG